MKEKLTSRERVLKTLNHQEPDRIPIDLGATINSSIVKEGYDDLRKHLGLPESSTSLISSMMRSVLVEKDVHDYFDTDVRGVYPGAPQSIEWIDDYKFRDEWGIVRTKYEDVYYFEQKEYPLSGNISINDIINYQWPDPDDPMIVKDLKLQVEKIQKRTDCAIVANLPSPLIHKSQYLRGFTDWYIDCASNVKLLETLFDAVLEVNLKTAENVLGEIGQDVDVVMCGDDLGTQSGLQVSPAFFRAAIKPRLKKYFDTFKKFAPQAKVFYHSCGSIVDILPDLIEIGVEVLNPVQVSARGMDTKYLKKEYGDKISYWGAIDTQHVLCKGSTEDVRREVEKRIDDLGRNGGYVLGAVHNIQPDISPENIKTMYQHAIDYSKGFYNS